MELCGGKEAELEGEVFANEKPADGLYFVGRVERKVIKGFGEVRNGMLEVVEMLGEGERRFQLDP